MPRGRVPRQPARTGRQDKVKVNVGRTLPSTSSELALTLSKGQALSANSLQRHSTGSKKSHVATGALASPTPKGHQKPTAKSKPREKTKGYNPIAPERVAEILHRLDQLYPDVTCALTHASAWELVVATILSAQSTDVNVNRVTPELFRKYPTVQAFAALTPEQLEPDVRSTGFFRNKSKSVVGAAKKIVADFGGQVPTDMEDLLTLPGVARKTANVVLGSFFKKAEGVVVDTHVHRISRRLELTTQNDPVKIEQNLMKVIPREK